MDLYYFTNNMELLFIISLGAFIGYEIQKIIQFNYFLKLKCIVSDYYNQILKKQTTVAYKEIIKISLVDFAYSIVTFIGLFTINLYFFYALIFLSILTNMFFKYVKNKKIRKIYFILDIVLSILLLSLPIINMFFYHLTSAQFIAQLINIKL